MIGFCLGIGSYKIPDVVNVHDWTGPCFLVTTAHWLQMMSPVEDGSNSTMAGSDNASPLFISCQLRKIVKSAPGQNSSIKLHKNNDC